MGKSNRLTGQRAPGPASDPAAGGLREVRPGADAAGRRGQGGEAMADGESILARQKSGPQSSHGSALEEIIEPGWAKALEPVAGQVAAMGDFLRAEVAAGRTYLPSGANVLRAFQQPFDEVKVLIVGQDPYPTPGHAVGLSFSVAPEVRPLPGSLINIFQEYPRTWASRSVQRRPDAVDPARRAAAQPGATTAPPASRARTGARAGRTSPSRRSGRWWSAARGPWWRSSGAATPGSSPAAGRRPASSRPTRARFRRPRLLRLPPLQPGQRPAGQAGRRAG